MDPQVVVVLTWVVAGLVVAAYIWFIVWRYRVEQRKKAADAVEEAKMSDTIARTAQRMDEAVSTSAPPLPKRTPATTLPSASSGPADPLPTSAPVSRPEPMRSEPSTSREATVADRVSGIRLPHDLAPLTTMAPRLAAGDRVAFWTDRAPVEVVGPAFADELERLGYTVASLDPQSLAATRNDDHLMVVIHPDGPAARVDGQLAFTSVPEHSVVIEVWIPG